MGLAAESLKNGGIGRAVEWQSKQEMKGAEERGKRKGGGGEQHTHQTIDGGGGAEINQARGQAAPT